MDNPAWLFAIASIIAVVGIVIAFKQLIAKVHMFSDDEENLVSSLQKEMGRFFMKVGIIEAVPLILVVFGFVLIENAGDVDVVLPLVVVAGALIFGFVNVFLTRVQLFADRTISDRTKALVTTYTFIGIALVNAVPFISIVFLLIRLLEV